MCDILATDLNKQLVVIELKNTIDRYIVQQLTRYYDSLQTHQPFSGQVNYSLPIRLVAIAPQFHKHSFIDRRHSLLTYQFASFRIIQTSIENLHFELVDTDTAQTWSIAIPSKFHQAIASIFAERTEATTHNIPSPPRSLKKILVGTSPQTEARILAVREQILNFDPRMREVGLTTRTQYGFAKGDKDIYQGKLCAEILPSRFSNFPLPRLLLNLPYPQKKRAGSYYEETYKKGMAWAEIAGEEQWDHQKICFYLGKSQTRYSFYYTLEDYMKVYDQLTGRTIKLDSLNSLINLALQEWLDSI